MSAWPRVVRPEPLRRVSGLLEPLEPPEPPKPLVSSSLPKPLEPLEPPPELA